jgi:hypothetical protein
MTYDDAMQFLDENNVEKGIRCAASAGAIMFAIMIDLEEWKGPGPLEVSHGITILSTSRKRNIELLTQPDDRWVPLGVVRYVAAAQRLEIVPRNRFKGRPEMVLFLREQAQSSLTDDPDLAAIVREYAIHPVAVKWG